MTAQNPNLAELDRRLAEKQISGIWRIPPGVRPGDPKTKVQPYLWKWADVYDGLLQARDQIDIERGTAERRTLRLVAAVVPGEALILTSGFLWYTLLTGMSWGPALAGSVLPFLPFDVLKIALVVAAVRGVELATSK